MERRVDRLQTGVATLAATVREGFEEMRLGFAEMRAEFRAINQRLDGIDRRLDGMDRRLDELTDVVHRIYTEHGQRLSNLEEYLRNHSAA